MFSCADGYIVTDKNICALPSSRLLLLNADYDILWASINGNSSVVNVPIRSNSASITFQPRYLSLNDKDNKVYFIDTKLNELWEFDLKENRHKKLLEGSVARLSSIAVDSSSGNRIIY
jgi:hypothetical protein